MNQNAGRSAPVLDIRGIWEPNRGSLLMLQAVVARLSNSYRVGVGNRRVSASTRSKLGVDGLIQNPYLPRFSMRATEFAHPRLRSIAKIAAPSEVGAVLDASGFAYADAFSLRRTRSEVLAGRDYRARGVPRILLPQAIGPLSTARRRSWVTELLHQSDLVFARDDDSEQWVRALAPAAMVERGCDFTIGLPATGWIGEPLNDTVLIVPNVKLIASGISSLDGYVRTLEGWAKSIEALGLAAGFLVHESSDHALARRVAGQRWPVIDSPDPQVLKGALAAARAVVSGRYHAAVGALSMGVPTLTVGWSAKYRHLAADFGVPSWDLTPEADLLPALKSAIDDAEALQRLTGAREDLLANVDRMWRTTEDFLATATRCRLTGPEPSNDIIDD